MYYYTPGLQALSGDQNGYFWLGERSIFQTFEELDSIPDKETELKEIRHLLDNNTTPHKEEM